VRPVAEWLAANFGSTEALIEVALVGAICGVVGVHVVLRRLPFLTIGLAHATFPGLVIAGLIGVNLLTGTLAFGALMVVVIVVLGAADRVETSTAIGVVLAGGIALGVVLVSGSDGFSRDLTAYLVGSIATVSYTDVVISAAATAVVGLVLLVFHKELVLGAFDPASLAARGYPVLVLDLVMLLAIEVTVVTALPAMGTILCVALLVSPPAAARLWTDRIGTTMALAAALGVASGVIGLAVSVAADTATGATIALVAGSMLAVSAVISPSHGWLATRLPRSAGVAA